MIVEIKTQEQYQYPILPTGCEVTATSILLNSLMNNHGDRCKLNIDKISKESLANKIIKEQDPDPITKLVGNPYRAFIGSPYSKDSFGVFHQPIYNLIKQILNEDIGNENIEVIDLTTNENKLFKYSLILNESKEYIQSRLDYFENDSNNYNDEDFEILKNHMIKYNLPIIIWMTLELKKPNLTDEWIDVNNQSQPLYWVSPEHCATLSGFDEIENKVIITDPHTGKIERYCKTLFLKRWRQLGRQAVSIKF
ncbi:hypothetical protein RB653_006651 [Dictyostelium firmibasis]|uniref:Peptidase C39-like domain-containing protein n=1 Tax=Dictyostelium firmibasis TaxID=79012 RepID=A0AAN7TU88_9MYCE